MLSGDEDLTTWSDEELLAGKRRNRRGNFAGRSPKVVPTAILQELTRRRFQKAEEVVKSSLVSAVELWKQIVEDETVDIPTRLAASRLIVERCWGKPTERIDANVEVKEPVWMQAMRRVIRVNGTPAGDLPEVREAMGYPVAPGSQIIDAEVIEDEDDPVL